MHHLLKKLSYFAILLVFVARPALAMESFVIKDIRVEGLERITPGTVFNYLPLKVGDTFDEARSAEAIRALFKTGFFSDVELYRDGDVLVVKVKERPAISKITITGNKDIKTDTLVDGLNQIGLAEGRVFDRSLLDRAEQELHRQYFSLGKYAVKIHTKVTKLDKNRVSIAIDISEGRVARIRQINIVGNKAFSDKELVKKFKLTTPTLLSFITKSDQYSRQKLSGDLETLRSFYLDRGYINFTIDSTQVSITPDKTSIYITINVTEGAQFKISDVKIAGDLILPKKKLVKLVTIKPGMIFSRKEVTQSSSNITDRLGDDGYAFANVNAVPKIDNKNDTVGITFFVDPGKRVYVRRINFSGNAKTRDEVLRREMRQMEGGWFSTAKIKRSKIRLQRLGYFEDVNVETPAVPGTTDEVDVNFNVKERPSGNLLLGLGFSQSQGIIFNSSITQKNFLGSGKSVSFAFNNSNINRRYALGYTNPYWTINGVSRGFHASYSELNSSAANLTVYDNRTASGGVSFGVPVSEYNAVNLGLDFEHTKILTNPNFVASEVTQFINENGNTYNLLLGSLSFSYDTRNKALLPTRGTLSRIALEMSMPGGDLYYYKLDYKTQWFHPITDKYTLMLEGNLGYGNSYGSTSHLPFFANFFAGGPRSVRGFQESTLGPKDSLGRAIGGNIKVVGDAEVILPVPFASDVKSIRLSAFADAGNVYGYNERFDLSTLRYSAGLSGIWLSPFGVLTVSVAAPFNKQPGDRTQPFQFTFGTSF